MGLKGTARSTAGSVRAFPTFGRRMFHSEQRLDRMEARLDDVARSAISERSAVIAELTRRIGALEQQVEGLHATLTSADPQMTLDIVSGVRANVAELSLELTEQMNRTSALLASLADATASS